MAKHTQTLGTVIRDQRKKRGLTQDSLALEAGIHRAYLSRVERDEQIPTIETLFKLARALKTSAAKILAKVEGESEELLEEDLSGLPPEHLARAERELREIIATGDTDAAAGYIRLKMLESYTLCMRNELGRWRQSMET